MIYLLLGEDIYAKQQYLGKFLEKNTGDLIKYGADSKPPSLGELGGDSLFGDAPIYVFSGCIGKYEVDELEKASQGPAQIFFLEDSLDKRLNKTKRLMEISEVKDFPAPAIDKAGEWILAHASQLEIKIQPAAVAELISRLFGETKKTLPVALAHNELLKLSSYAGDNSITKEMVFELTPQDLDTDMFALLDHIAGGRKSQAIEMLHQYYSGGGEDEKTQTIRLVALLSDQLRSLLITVELIEQGLSDKDILSATGWKTGRLFVMKKLSRNFSKSKLTGALSKLYSLDKELKSSTLPPRVIVDMIVAAM